MRKACHLAADAGFTRRRAGLRGGAGPSPGERARPRRAPVDRGRPVGGGADAGDRSLHRRAAADPAVYDCLFAHRPVGEAA